MKGEQKMKNKKQLFVTVLILVFCLAMTTTALAAASPEVGSTQVVGVPSGVYLDVENTKAITGTEKTEIQGLVNPPTGSTFLAYQVMLKNADGSEYHGTATVTLTIAGLKVGDSVSIYHKNADGTITVVPASAIKVENGKVTFTSTFSPIAVVIQAGNGVSPKTGQSQSMVLWLVIAVMALSMVVVSTKKVLAK
jgi:hypothetical protein